MYLLFRTQTGCKSNRQLENDGSSRKGRLQRQTRSQESKRGLSLTKSIWSGPRGSSLRAQAVRSRVWRSCTAAPAVLQPDPSLPPPAPGKGFHKEWEPCCNHYFTASCRSAGVDFNFCVVKRKGSSASRQVSRSKHRHDYFINRIGVLQTLTSCIRGIAGSQIPYKDCLRHADPAFLRH